MDTTPISTVARVRGWLLILLGSCLSIGLAAITVYLSLTILHNDQPGGTHWTGSHEMTVKVFSLFATIFVFGLVAIGAGIFQLQRGRPNWLALGILAGLVLVMYLLGQSIMQTKG